MAKIDEKYDKHVFGDGKRPGEGPDMPEYISMKLMGSMDSIDISKMHAR